MKEYQVAKSPRTKISEEKYKAGEMVVDQNGNNPHFYRKYDKDGRIVATKEGITTVPSEMTPRERFVDRSKSIAEAYVPTVGQEQISPVDVQNQPKAFTGGENVVGHGGLKGQRGLGLSIAKEAGKNITPVIEDGKATGGGSTPAPTPTPDPDPEP